VRKFSVRPTLTMKGRTFKGLRGWSGKPLHPPLTDLPIAASILGAVFDVSSAVAGRDHTEPVTPIGIAVLSVVIALPASVGAMFGSSPVYDYGSSPSRPPATTRCGTSPRPTCSRPVRLTRGAMT
jgi:uncharacterized membrane protein